MTSYVTVGIKLLLVVSALIAVATLFYSMGGKPMHADDPQHFSSVMYTVAVLSWACLGCGLSALTLVAVKLIAGQSFTGPDFVWISAGLSFPLAWLAVVAVSAYR